VKSKALDRAMEEGANGFAKLAKDSRLTEAENAVLVEKLSEMREAFIELLLKKREKSHDRDFVAGRVARIVNLRELKMFLQKRARVESFLQEDALIFFISVMSGFSPKPKRWEII